MIAGLWRNTHFLLALTASLFLVVAALTGALLGFEALLDRTKPQAVELNDLSLGQVKQTIDAAFQSVYEIELNRKGYIIVQGEIANDFDSYYINPKEGTVLGKQKPSSPFFQSIRSLHRSLFLKETGRILMSLVSFLLTLLVLSGLFLLRKRMGSFTQLYAAVHEPNTYRKTHIILGRWFWLIVLLVGVTGTYLGLERMEVFIGYEEKKETYHAGSSIVDLNAIALTKLEKLVYPFGDAPGEHYDLTLIDRSIKFQQGDYSLTEVRLKPWPQLVQQWSYVIHTGEGNFFLALLLTITAMVILYFIFSGLSIASKTSWALLRFKRQKQQKSLLILYGSETGSTYGFAKRLKKRLKKDGIPADIGTMNRFQLNQNTQTLVVLTATYGEGEAPANASRFVTQFNRQNPDRTIAYAVLGFGSRSYPKFCQFSIEVDALLDQHPAYVPLIPLFKINNQDTTLYDQWETLFLNALRSQKQK